VPYPIPIVASMYSANTDIMKTPMKIDSISM
jgi:hypothetical protein